MRDLGNVNRVVVKVGSAVIAGTGRLQPQAVSRLAADVAALRQRGVEVVVVSSGAIASGYRLMGLQRTPTAVLERQSAASVGQPKLMAALGRAFGRHRIQLAQLLLSAEDIENRQRFLSARHTLQVLLARGIVPIINENDALSTDQTRVGDNDHLAALVTNLVTAQLLILLSVAKGLMADGGKGEVIPTVALGSSIDRHIGRTTSDSGVGGMVAKVSAAHLARHWGVATIVADGLEPRICSRLLAGEELGTIFLPRAKKLSARKQWIAVRARSLGSLSVDAGAREAIVRRGASLLPSGIVGVDGRFPMGARVDLRDADGGTFAVGLVSYSSHEINRLKGRRQSEVKAILGYEYIKEIVNRDDLVVLES